MADQPPPGGSIVAMPGAQTPPGGVAAATPQAQGTDQPPPGGNIVSMPGAAAPPERSWLERGANAVANLPGMQEATGFMKGAEKDAAGLTELLSKQYLGPPPGQEPTAVTRVAAAAMPGAQLAQALPESVRAPARHVAQITADWLRKNTETHGWEKAGDIGETVATLMAMPEVGAETMGAKALSYSEHLLEAAKTAKTLEQSSKLLRVVRMGLNSAARSGAEMGTQTLVRTGGDVNQATKAGVEGAVIGGAVGTGAAAYREGRQALSEYAQSQTAPPPRSIRNEDFTTTREGKLLKPADPLADTTTQQAENVVQDLGQRGVARSLMRSNAGRPTPMTRIARPSRMLPAPEGSPQGFSVGTTPPEEVGLPPQTSTVTEYGGTRTIPNPDYEAPTGTLTKEPGQTVEQAAEDIGTTAQATPERAITGPKPIDTRNPTQRRIDAAQGRVPTRMLIEPETVTEPVYQQRPVITKEGTQALGGGGTLILTANGKATSVERARAAQQRMESTLNNPAELNEMGVRDRDNLIAQHQDISEQLRRYDDYAASEPNFPEHNISEATRSVDGIKSGGQLLKDTHRPFWQTADAETQKQFTLLTKQEKGLRQAIRSPNLTTTDRIAKLDDLRDVHDKVLQMFDQNRTKFTPQEWKIAREGYEDGAALDELGSHFEAHMGGITKAEAARRPGLRRSFEPGSSYNDGLEKIYQKRGTALKRLIGTDGMDDMKELGQLFQNPQRQEASKQLLDYLASSIKAHYRGIHGVASGAGGGGMILAGHLAAGATGISAPLATGTIAGLKRYVTERIASDPRFAKQFIYAVKNGVGPRMAATLLASSLIHGQQQPVQTPPPEETK
jgi:hypothetical protein